MTHGAVPPSVPVLSFPAPHVLRTARLQLRPMRPADADALHAILNDPKVLRYWDTPPWPDVAHAREFIVDEQRALAEGESLTLGIYQDEPPRLIGECLLFALDWDAGRAELGFALAPGAWGCGYLHEAAGALLDYGFDRLQLRRIEAEINVGNAAAARALERLGFQHEGVLRERWAVNGRISDAAFYGLLAREWAARTAA
ncbi:MAG: GNAT family N-acetyltransferase [Proteobacteria bacterium]|nr:GNAT family N-acetyltransferase [Pseudomonadota bacterium]